ncbi:MULTISPECIES: EAL domain-containing protein [unclassified Janthinobacterium]|uniref:EAL domain-containing protein n=1 Tax=unclassified Janthinobacterium TaxID=2610881 RepID=UPI0018CB6473|nr:EAL domain-containing protein [Janthinobacterium sp. CG_23.4]MDH6159719.1 diguanylate cyclase (GGDEF)-like protein [Janthinobacterium sp. CG_23.4]
MISQADIYAAKILIVDDHEVNVRLLEHLLGSGGYTAITSTLDARTVVGLHQRHQFDLIILDLVMPAMSGYAVMDALRPLELEGYLPVLVIAADPEAKLAALEAGARDFISKPFDALEVLTRIRNMLEVRLLHRAAHHYNTLLERTVGQRTAELQRFRGAMDATSDAIFLVDVLCMTLVDVNDGACRLLGYARGELLALAPGTLLPSPPSAPLTALPDGPVQLAMEVTECELLRCDLSLVPVELGWHWYVQAPVAGGQGPGGLLLIAVARDISERRQAQERLKHLAHYDGLTGLPNRSLFYQALAQAVELAQEKRWRIVVLCIGLDRFKSINDTLGAALGDELLRQFSNRLVQCVRLRDTVGRLGNDEFALILSMSRNQQDAVVVANQVRVALRAPFDLRGHAATLTASIGIAMYPADATDPETLIKYANTAMDGAKQAGRDGYRFFTAGMNVQVLVRLDLELALRHAIEHEQFILYYQPKVDLRTGGISGVEALLRWRRPGYGLVAPAEFVPVLEDTGLIVRVGAWVIQAACRQIAEWRDSEVGPVHVAVNVSSRQFAEGDLEGEVTCALAQYGVAPELLELELTETALMSSAEHTIVVLGKLKKIGVKVAIDDFGTGYSSLAYLQRFPIDKLKIDIAFVRNITSNPNDAAIALAIVSMAHSLKLRVVAEGVESRPQLEYLRRNRCDEIQGLYFSRALPALELGQMIVVGAGLPPGLDPTAQPAQTLLIVDDDVNVLSSLHRLLRPEGYQILTASTPGEGFEMLALHRVHVIVCEQRMPSMSGTEFLSKVKELYPETIRIILSSYTGFEAVLDSINRGAIYRFYTKPWDDTELRDNIRLAFQHYWMVNQPGLARAALR